MLEFSARKAFTSTGPGAWMDATTSERITFIAETAVSSATMIFEARQKGGTTAIALSTANLSASQSIISQINGPFYQVRPRVSDVVGTVTISWFGR